MTQKQLAVKVGVTMQQIWKYETASGHIAVSRLIEVARALGVPASVILGEIGNGGGVEAPNHSYSHLFSLSGIPDQKIFDLIRLISEMSALIAFSDCQLNPDKRTDMGAGRFRERGEKQLSEKE